MSKPKFAMYWAGSCGGCEIAVLEIHEHLLELADAVEIVFWPCVMDAKHADVESMAAGSIDLCLFNGAICTTENQHMAELLRSRSKVLVAFGACATMGGIPELANLAPRRQMFDCVYRTTASTMNPDGILPQAETRVAQGIKLSLPELLPRVLPLSGLVDVDYFVPGCPPTGGRVWSVLRAFMSNELPAVGSVVGAGDKAVCDECPLRKEDARVSAFRRMLEVIPEPERCLLEQGIVCAGPATRSGCGAECLEAGFPCRGCYGPAGQAPDQGTALANMLGGLIEKGDEQQIRAALAGIVDPAGTLYRYGLAASLLARVPRGNEGDEG